MKRAKRNINPYTFTGSAVIVGFLLIDQFTLEELSSVGNWLQVVGLIMQTYASQVSTIQSTTKQANNEDVDTLNRVLNAIQEELKNIKNGYKNC